MHGDGFHFSAGRVKLEFIRSLTFHTVWRVVGSPDSSDGARWNNGHHVWCGGVHILVLSLLWSVRRRTLQDESTGQVHVCRHRPPTFDCTITLVSACVCLKSAWILAPFPLPFSLSVGVVLSFYSNEQSYDTIESLQETVNEIIDIALNYVDNFLSVCYVHILHVPGVPLCSRY